MCWWYHRLVTCYCPDEQGVKLLGLLLTWSAGPPRQIEIMGWPDIHWLGWDKGGLVAAMFEVGLGFG
jgi:hypothetical protein